MEVERGHQGSMQQPRGEPIFYALGFVSDTAWDLWEKHAAFRFRIFEFIDRGEDFSHNTETFPTLQ